MKNPKSISKLRVLTYKPNSNKGGVTFYTHLLHSHLLHIAIMCKRCHFYNFFTSVTFYTSMSPFTHQIYSQSSLIVLANYVNVDFRLILFIAKMRQKIEAEIKSDAPCAKNPENAFQS